MLFGASVYSALLAAAIAAVASLLFLRTRNFLYDSVALASTELGLVVLAAGIISGAAGGHSAVGSWWTWDARLTAALVCWLLYASYLMLRSAVEEPSRRAASAAIVSIFAIFDIPVIVIAVRWWLAARGRTIPVTLDWTLAPVLLIGCLLAVLRFRKEQRRRAADAERRTAQEI